MLVLTIKKGKNFTIGENIKVSVLSIDRNQVRVGIDAPKEIQILREDSIKKQPD